MTLVKSLVLSLVLAAVALPALAETKKDVEREGAAEAVYDNRVVEDSAKDAEMNRDKK